jgi:hypothetical protein
VPIPLEESRDLIARDSGPDLQLAVQNLLEVVRGDEAGVGENFQHAGYNSLTIVGPPTFVPLCKQLE